MRSRNIIFYVTRQYMRSNRRRTWLTFAGIVLMVVLLTTVFVGRDTGLAYLETVAAGKDGKWHVSMYDVTARELEEVKALSYVTETAVSSDWGYTEFEGSANEKRPYLYIKNYSEACFDWMNIHVTQGRLPQAADEILVSEGVRTDQGTLEIGDEVKARSFERTITGMNPDMEYVYFPFQEMTLHYQETLKVPQDFPWYGDNDSFRENREYTGQEQVFQVVGFMESPSFEASGAAGYTALAWMEGESAALPEQFNLTLILNQDQAPEDYTIRLREIAGNHEISFNDYVLAFSGKSSNSTMNLVVKFLVVFFTGLIMLTAVILISNVFRMSFRERCKYLGMLDSVGATGRQKRSSIYYEAFWMLLFALPIGITGGILVVEAGMLGIRPLMGKMLLLENYLPQGMVPLQVSVQALLWVLFLSIATVFFSAYLPARQVQKAGPMDAIRGWSGGNISAGVSGKRRTAAKEREAAVGDRVGKAKMKKRSGRYRIQPRLIRLAGAEGMLAWAGVRRQKKKTRSIVLSAASFLVIFAVTVYGAEAIRKIVSLKLIKASNVSLNLEGWDYIFYSDGEIDEELKKEIEADPGVDAVMEWYDGMFMAMMPGDIYSAKYWQAFREIFDLYYHRELTDAEWQEMNIGENMTLNIFGVNRDTLETLSERTGADLSQLTDTENPGAILVNYGELSTDSIGVGGMTPEKYRFYRIDHMTNLTVGDQIPAEFSLEDGSLEIPLKVAAVADEKHLEGILEFHDENLWLIMDMEVLKEIQSRCNAGIEPVSAMAIRMNGEETDLPERLTRLSEESENSIFTSTDRDKTMGEAIVQIVYVLLICFMLLTSVICLLNLTNSISSRMQERTQELAILESIGMTGKQMKKLLLMECGEILARGILLATVTAALLIKILERGLTIIFGHTTFTIPWPLYITALLSLCLAVTLITLHTLTRQRTQNLLAAIRQESI